MLLFDENKPKETKDLSKHLRFNWHQLFDLLYNSTISLKSFRPNIKLK